MKDELDKKLCAKYPLIFRDRHADMRTTCMCWGFEIGEGWYNIVDTLCAGIQGHINWTNESRDYNIKWNSEHPDNQRKIAEPVPQVVAVQVKEKFGGLRFYVDGGDDYTDGMVALAESLSYRTCEYCGNPGRPTRGGWIKTMCEAHAKENNRVLESEQEQDE